MTKARESWSEEDNHKDSKFSRIADKAGELYRAYTSGLRAGDFKKLFTEESLGVYTRFHTEETEEKKEKGLKGTLKSLGRIFWGFLLALTPARRVLYGIAFLLFAVSAVIMLTAPYTSPIRQDMATLTIYSFIITSFLLALELADKLSVRDEIEIAREIQVSLLPPEDPSLPGLKVSSFSAPAQEVGGDYYDFSVQDGSALLAIGDVSGHGLGAGLVMAMAKSAWQAQLMNDAHPAAVLRTLQEVVLSAGTSRTLMSFLHCRINPDTGEMIHANAGHIFPLLIRHNDGPPRWLETPSTYPLGAGSNRSFMPRTHKLQPGDILMFVSDGAIESTNEKGESFGYRRLAAAAGNCEASEPSKILKTVLEALDTFVGSEKPEDDTTIIVVRYDGLN